jgi:Tfp pilus assembly protein PilN
MLRSNLSTRPFYNERRIHVAAAIVALLVIAFSAWNIARLVTLSTRRAELRSHVQSDEQVASDLRSRADSLERSVDRAALASAAASAREANAVIDRRTFSWTTFFNRLEDTLPPGVMLSSVTPQIEGRDVMVTMVLIARRTEEVEDFATRLEGLGAFRDVRLISDTIGDDGLHRVALSGRYQ